MATQDETKQELVECLSRIGQKLKITFREYEIEVHTQGKFRPGTWTYKISHRRVTLEYWFSSFSSRKEETDISYQTDNDAQKLETGLTECFDKVREAVKRKKGMF